MLILVSDNVITEEKEMYIAVNDLYVLESTIRMISDIFQL